MRGVSSRIVVSAWAGMVIIVAETPTTTLEDVVATAAMAVKRSFLDHMRLLFDEVVSGSDRGRLLRRGCVEGRICFYGSKYCSSPQGFVIFSYAKGQVWGYSS